MHAAAYFVPQAQGQPTAHMPASPGPATLGDFAAIADQSSEDGCRVPKMALVAGLHLALFAWLAHIDSSKRPTEEPIRLEVRTIAMSTPASPTAASIAPSPARVQPKPVEKIVAPQPKKAVAKPVEQLLKAQTAHTASVAHADSALPATTETAGAAETRALPPSGGAAGAAAPAGGAVSAARFDADYLNNPAPAYPISSRRQREEGKVQLDVTVSAEGRATEVRLRQSSGYPRLDDAALETVKQWRFVPARRGSEAVVAKVIVPIEFRLAN